MTYRMLVFLLLSLCISCKSESKKETKKEVQLLEPVIFSPKGKSALPHLYATTEKTLLSWVAQVGDSLNQLKYAELVAGQWQEPKDIFEGKDWFVNWADFPAIAEQNGNMISHVLKKSSAGTYSYDVKLNLLQKGETEWKTNQTLHTDTTATEHGFVSMLPYKDGFFVTWLDGRNTVADENGIRGAMTIRAAEVSYAGKVRNEVELDRRVCDCCQTTAAITANGPVVLYRDRSDDEYRDMSIVRWENGKWTSPKKVFEDNWKIKGCPVNGPKASAKGNSLAMAWFTAANKAPKVQLIFSEDGGVTFDVPIVLADANVIGRVDVVLVDKKIAIVSWVEAKDGKALVMAAKVERNQTQVKPLIITEMDASRQSGFPQMELVGGKVLFAWTAIGQNTSQVKTAFVALTHF